MDEATEKKGVWELTPEELQSAKLRLLELLNSGGRWSGRKLAVEIGLKSERELRKLVFRLRFMDNIPILGWPGHGYEMARTAVDVKRYIDQTYRMARDYFALGSKLSGTTADIFTGQMMIRFFGAEAASDVDRESPQENAWALFLTADRRKVAMANLVGEMLREMKRNPALYDEGLQKLRKEFGSLLLTPDQVRWLKETGGRMLELTGGKAQS